MRRLKQKPKQKFIYLSDAGLAIVPMFAWVAINATQTVQALGQFNYYMIAGGQGGGGFVRRATGTSYNGEGGSAGAPQQGVFSLDNAALTFTRGDSGSSGSSLDGIDDFDNVSAGAGVDGGTSTFNGVTATNPNTKGQGAFHFYISGTRTTSSWNYVGQSPTPSPPIPSNYGRGGDGTRYQQSNISAGVGVLQLQHVG